MGKPVAVASAVIISQAGAVFSGVIQGTQVANVKAQGQAVLTDLQVMISGYMIPGAFVQSAPVVVSFTSTAQKVKAGGSLVMLEGDKTQPVTISGTNPASGSPATVTDTFVLQSAGQTKVTAA